MTEIKFSKAIFFSLTLILDPWRSWMSTEGLSYVICKIAATLCMTINYDGKQFDRLRLMMIKQEQRADFIDPFSHLPDSYGQRFLFLIPQNGKQSASFLLVTNPNVLVTNFTMVYFLMQNQTLVRQTNSFRIQPLTIATVIFTCRLRVNLCAIPLVHRCAATLKVRDAMRPNTSSCS